jgi:hypothetical protein
VTLLVALALGVLRGGPSVALAQGESARGVMPARGDHVFVPTSFIPDAFIKTMLGLNVGYANTIETDVPIYGPGGQQIATVEGGLLFLTGTVEFNCAVRDWIGFFARVNMLARAGNNTASIFASGVSAGSGFGLGWEARLWQSERAILSGSVGIDQTSVTVIDIGTFVEDLMDTTGTGPEPSLSQSYTPLVGSGSVQYAYGASDLVGFSAYAGVGVGENPGDDLRNAWFWRLGAVASFNLATRYDVPLGAAIGLRTSSFPLTFENADGNATAGLISVAYMGRPDFSITLDVTYERVPLRDPDVTVGYVGTTIGLRYYF